MIKYSRTYHLPFSCGTSDDKMLKDCSAFEGKTVVCLEKMDGENTTMTRDRCYARSVDSVHHKSRDWVKYLHGTIRMDIPEGWRICGENLFATHSIYYENLGSYFMVFNIWNEHNEALSYNETLEWCDVFGLLHVPELISPKVFDERELEQFSKTIDTDVCEGFVIRNVDGFHYDDFGVNVAKFVRNNHIKTDKNWKQNWKQNGPLR